MKLPRIRCRACRLAGHVTPGRRESVAGQPSSLVVVAPMAKPDSSAHANVESTWAETKYRAIKSVAERTTKSLVDGRSVVGRGATLSGTSTAENTQYRSPNG